MIAVAALALRVGALEFAPLNGYEAREALLAWSAVETGHVEEVGLSPLLFTINRLVFSMTSATDVAARLAPALCGGVLVLLPLLWRAHLTRVGSLAAGAYLALSPTALVASRQLDGTVFGVTGIVAFVGALVYFRRTGRRAWLLVAAVALATALVAGPASIGPAVALTMAAAISAAIWPALDLRRLFRAVAAYWPVAFAVLVGSSAAMATGLGWHPSGLGALGGAVTAWLERFSRADMETPGANPLALLAIYEPVVVLLGIAGLVWAVRRRHRMGVFLGLWAAGGVMLMSAMPGRMSLDVLGCVVPLAMLTGIATREMLTSLTVSRHWQSARLYAPIVLALWTYVYLMLTRYANTANVSDLLLGLLGFLMQVLLAGLLGLVAGGAKALHAFGACTSLVLLLYTLSAGWGVTRARCTDPRELLLMRPTAMEVRDFASTLRELSWQRTGMPDALDVTLEVPSDPVIEWYLRDMTSITRVEDLEGSTLSDVLVTSRRDVVLQGTAYVGQDFVLARIWDPKTAACQLSWPLHCEETVRWLVLHRATQPATPARWAVVWVHPTSGG